MYSFMLPELGPTAVGWLPWSSHWTGKCEEGVSLLASCWDLPAAGFELKSFHPCAFASEDLWAEWIQPLQTSRFGRGGCCMKCWRWWKPLGGDHEKCSNQLVIQGASKKNGSPQQISHEHRQITAWTLKAWVWGRSFFLDMNISRANTFRTTAQCCQLKAEAPTKQNMRRTGKGWGRWSTWPQMLRAELPEAERSKSRRPQALNDWQLFFLPVSSSREVQETVTVKSLYARHFFQPNFTVSKRYTKAKLHLAI